MHKYFHLTKRNYKIYLFLFILISTLYSCDVPYKYEYNINNNTDTAIVVYLKRYYDTTIIINSKMTETIASYDNIEGPGGPFRRDIKEEFDTIKITFKNKPSTKNYKENSIWSFAKKSPSIGVYTADVFSTDF